LKTDEVLWNLFVDPDQELLELDGPVAAVQRAHDPAGGQVQGGEQADRVVAFFPSTRKRAIQAGRFEGQGLCPMNGDWSGHCRGTAPKAVWERSCYIEVGDEEVTGIGLTV